MEIQYLYPLEFKKCNTFIKNTKYIIIHRSVTFTSVYIGFYLFSRQLENKFKIKINACFYCAYMKPYIYNMYNQAYDEVWIKHKELEVYQLVSKKEQIQNSMEYRALNIIISNIIGDKHFVWYNLL
jgi:hypothetical protein